MEGIKKLPIAFIWDDLVVVDGLVVGAVVVCAVGVFRDDLKGIKKLPIAFIRDDLLVVDDLVVGGVGDARSARTGERLRCRLNLLLAVSSIVIE
jgi:hypothetical protein